MQKLEEYVPEDCNVVAAAGLYKEWINSSDMTIETTLYAPRPRCVQ